MLEKGRIFGPELMHLITAFILGCSVLISPGAETKQHMWQVALLGTLEGGSFIWIFTVLLKRFPGKTVVEIMETVFGKFIGKGLATVFVLFLFWLGSLVIRDTLDFIKFTLLEQTPVIVVLMVGLSSCVYLVRSGVEVMGRCSQPLLFLTFALFLFISVLLVPEIHVENYFPLFDISISKLLRAVHATAAFPFAEVAAFLMIAPFLNRKDQITKSTFYGLLFGGLYLFLSAVRTVGILGDSVQVILYPGYHVARLINIADVFTRLEILVAVNFFLMNFMKISVLLYGSVLGTAQILKLSNYQPYVFPIGTLMSLMSVLVFENVLENIEFAEKIYPVVAPVASVGLPALTLFVALLRRLPKGAKK